MEEGSSKATCDKVLHTKGAENRQSHRHGRWLNNCQDSEFGGKLALTVTDHNDRSSYCNNDYTALGIQKNQTFNYIS